MAVTKRPGRPSKKEVIEEGQESTVNQAQDNLDFEATAQPGPEEEPETEAKTATTTAPAKTNAEISQELLRIVEEQSRVIQELKARLDKEKDPIGDLSLALKNISQDSSKASASPTLRDIQDDMLETPVSYFAYNYKFAILGYTAPSGHEVKVPDGTEVMFNPFQRYSRKTTARGVDTVSISMFTTKSKRMVEFLDNHPYMNVRFFRATGKQQTVGLQDHMYAVDAYHKVSKMTDMAVVEMLQGMGVPSSEDVQEMRKELIRRLASEMQSSADKMLKEASRSLAETALARAK